MAQAQNYPYAIRYKFTGSMDELENWIRENSKGQFSYELADVHETDTPFGQLDLIFYFEYSEDRLRFKERAKSKPAW